MDIGTPHEREKDVNTHIVVWTALAAAALPAADPGFALAGAPTGPNALVAGWTSHNVLRYDDSGAFVEPVAGAAQGLSLAHSVTVGPDGHLYVTSFGNDSVLRFDGHTGAALGIFVAPGSGGLDGPSNAVFGPDGRLYVTSLLNHRVLVYDGQDGAALGTFVAPGAGGLVGPESLRFKPDGDLLVVSGAGNSVLQYDGATGAFEGAFVTAGLGGLSDPHEAIFGPDGKLYVSAFGSKKVIAYDGITGALAGVLVQDVIGTPQDESGGLANAHGMAFDREGNLYVASFGTNQVLRYDGATGQFLGVFIAPGNGLSGPTGFTFTIPGDLDNDGAVNVIDFLSLLGDWGPCPTPCPPTCLSDLDGDCAVGILDFLILLSNWTA